MEVINKPYLNIISGGIWPAVVVGASETIGVIEAVSTGFGVYTILPTVFGADVYNNVGSYLGQTAFDITHQNPLGQMEYSADQFGYSYIAPITHNNSFG